MFFINESPFFLLFRVIYTRFYLELKMERKFNLEIILAAHNLDVDIF